MVAWCRMGWHVRGFIVGPCALGLVVDEMVRMVHWCGMGVCGIANRCLPV